MPTGRSNLNGKSITRKTRGVSTSLRPDEVQTSCGTGREEQGARIGLDVLRS